MKGDMTKQQWTCMRGVVADKATAVIEQYRGGSFHGREVSCILSEMFEAANDSFERMMLLPGEKTNISDPVGSKPAVTVEEWPVGEFRLTSRTMDAIKARIDRLERQVAKGGEGK